MIEPIRILVVEDQFFFRLALRSIVDARGDMAIVAETSKSREALSLFREHQPHLAIIDLRLPDASGLLETMRQSGALMPRLAFWC